VERVERNVERVERNDERELDQFRKLQTDISSNNTHGALIVLV